MLTRRVRGVLVGSVLGAVSAVALVPATASNDPLFAQQWGLTLVNAPQAWATSTGRGVTIGVVDTGVDLTHEDLAGKVQSVTATTNCVGSGGNPAACHGTGQDDKGHGTHVSGIAAAVTANQRGGAGMAPDARLLVAKALDSRGTGSTADINAGIHWVVDHGARVVNLSLGDPNFVFTSVLGTSLQDGIEYAWSQGAIPVLAAGNTNQFGLGSSNYGSLDAVVVGAVGRDDRLASYSSPTGDAKWALLAPGGSNNGVGADDVLSTYWTSGKSNSYTNLAGTSMATPFVAGALALLLAEGLTPTAAVSRLLSTVNHSVGCGGGSTNCHGRLDAAAAVAGLAPQGTAPAPAPTGGNTAHAPAAVSPGPSPRAPTPGTMASGPGVVTSGGAGAGADPGVVVPPSPTSPSPQGSIAPGSPVGGGTVAAAGPVGHTPLSAGSSRRAAHRRVAVRAWAVLAALGSLIVSGYAGVQAVAMRRSGA